MKQLYSKYLIETNINGSGKATSYIRALDLLSEMLIIQAFGFEDCIDIWCVTSLKRITELRELVTNEQRKGKGSIWLSNGITPSYLLNGYCKAALSSYLRFLAERTQENNLFELFETHQGDAAELSSLLDSSLVSLESENIQVLVDDLKDTSGENIIRSVKTRLNQNVFRRMLINIYNGSCCITGINIPEVNRASHIIPWADSPSKRLDPSNGLYLSATYDAAFDKHLISLDDDYRIIVSKEIKDHYTSQSVTEYFLKKEGHRINLPSSYQPNKQYLAKHRNIGEF